MMVVDYVVGPLSLIPLVSHIKGLLVVDHVLEPLSLIPFICDFQVFDHLLIVNHIYLALPSPFIFLLCFPLVTSNHVLV